MDEFEDDDFSDLYADVEVQVSSAFNAIEALTQLKSESDNDEVYGGENGGFQETEEGGGGGSGGVNTKAEEEVYDNGGFQEVEEGGGGGGNAVEGEEEEDRRESESESDDDFNIVLNYVDNANGNGNGGKVDKDEKCGIEEENEGNYAVENTGSSGGGQRGSGEKGGFYANGYDSQYKYMRSKSAGFSSILKTNASTAVAAYSSTFVRGDCENDGCAYQLGTRSIGSKSGCNFSLPRSRTILDINIDAFEQKPWRNPGADITDFFNFGFVEDSWKSYCNNLDRHRELTNNVTGSRGYQDARHTKDGKAGFGHEVAQEAVKKNIVHYNQTKEKGLANEVLCRQLQPEMLKGRAIQVENGLGERQPSVDTRLPLERDSDVIIEIPIQDRNEDSSNSDKVELEEAADFLHEASRKIDAALDDAGDMVCFSASELPILEGPPERTAKPEPHRSTADDDPSCSDSENSGSLHVSDANEQQHRMMECDSDGLAEEMKASYEPEKGVGWGNRTPTSKGTPESSQSEKSRRSHNSSPCRTDYVGSRVGAYEDRDKLHDDSKRTSPNSDSDLRESITFDYNSSKNPRKLGLRSSDFKKVARSRSPVRRNMKFHQKRSSRMSGLDDHLKDEIASHISDAEELYSARYPAVGCYKQRSRRHNFDSYEDKDSLYHEKLEKSLNYREARLPSKADSAFAGYPRRKDNRGYKGYPSPGQNVNQKQHFSEQTIPRLNNEVVEQKWNHHRKGISVKEMDSSNHDASRQHITEQSPYLDNVNYRGSGRKEDELYFKRRMKNDDFSFGRNYSTESTRDKYRPLSCEYYRESDYNENIHDRQLPYTRREAMSPLKSIGIYGSPIHHSEGIQHTDYEEDRSSYARNRLSFSYSEPQTAGMVRERTAPFSRNLFFERHGRRGRENYVERYRGCNNLDGYADVYIDDDASIQDSFVERREYCQSKVLHWSEEEYHSRHQEDIFEAERTSYPLGRTSRYKSFDSRPSSGHGRKLIPDWNDERRYKLPIHGNSRSQLDQSTDSFHRENLGQGLPSRWDSTDSRDVLGAGKSSRCFKAGSRMYYERYDFMDWNDDLEHRSSNGFNEPHMKKVVQAERKKTILFQDDANWSKKLSGMRQNDSLDIEEGQRFTKDLNKKPMQKATVSQAAAKFASMKKFPCESAAHQNIKVEELETPRMMDILAKMEKRRERFQQPDTLKNVSENQVKPFADSNAQSAEAKVQRPARKRKWYGS